MRYNRRRTALTMLGMAWGIATVVLLLAYGDGFGAAIGNIFATFGTRVMIVVSGTHLHAGRRQKAGEALRFTLEDIDLLTTNVPQITHISPGDGKQSNVQYETRAFSFFVNGGYPEHGHHPGAEDRAGTLLRHGRRAAGSHVAIIGSEAKEKLFSGRNALGERIRIDGISLK